MRHTPPRWGCRSTSSAWSQTRTSYGTGCSGGTPNEDEGRRWHLRRAAELHAIQEASAVEDHVVDTTSGSAAEVAVTVLRIAGWAT